MPDILRPHITEPADESERAYVPFLAAMENNIIDLGSVVVRHLRDPIGVVLGNGRIPQQNDAGIVPLDRDGKEILAVDHTHLVDMAKGHIQLGPSSKNDVDKRSGVIRNEGLLTITSPDGWLRIVGAVVDCVKNPWLAHDLDATRTKGRLAVARFGLAALDYEVTDVNAETGILTAKPRTSPK